MPKRSIALVFVAAPLVLCAVLFAQTDQQPTAVTGQPTAVPDLSGPWNPYYPPDANNPYGRPFLYFTKEEPPMQLWAEESYKAIRKGESATLPDMGRTDLDPTRYPYCMPVGFPRVYNRTAYLGIVQFYGRVYIIFEGGVVQQIYTDGRKHPKGPPLTFMGQSIGRYEGDTLVVETKDLNDMTWLDWIGHPHSDALRVEQHIRRVDHGNLQIELLFDNPKTYTKPWMGKRVYKSRSTKDAAKEYSSDNFPCEDCSKDEFSRKVLGKAERDDAWRELRDEGSGY
jgi:hypothetical protein